MKKNPCIIKDNLAGQPRMNVLSNSTVYLPINRIILLSILILFSIPLLAQNNSNAIFSQGVTHYDERNYEKALEQFLILEENGIISSELYYNIGNSYYRMGKIGKAILYYKRGLRIKPNDMQIKTNLEYAISRTQDRQILEESNPLIDTLRKIVNSLSINGWLLISSLFFITLILIIDTILVFYRHKDRTVLYFLLGITVVLFLISVGVTQYRYSSLFDKTEAVLTSHSANAYSGPDTEFTHLFTINEGMIFKVIRKDNEWSHIQLPNTDIRGWIKNDYYQTVSIN